MATVHWVRPCALAESPTLLGPLHPSALGVCQQPLAASFLERKVHCFWSSNRLVLVSNSILGALSSSFKLCLSFLICRKRTRVPPLCLSQACCRAKYRWLTSPAGQQAPSQSY